MFLTVGDVLMYFNLRVYVFVFVLPAVGCCMNIIGSPVAQTAVITPTSRKGKNKKQKKHPLMGNE